METLSSNKRKSRPGEEINQSTINEVPTQDKELQVVLQT